MWQGCSSLTISLYHNSPSQCCSSSELAIALYRSVLDELRELWETKLRATGVLNAPPSL